MCDMVTFMRSMRINLEPLHRRSLTMRFSRIIEAQQAQLGTRSATVSNTGRIFDHFCSYASSRRRCEAGKDPNELKEDPVTPAEIREPSATPSSTWCVCCASNTDGFQPTAEGAQPDIPMAEAVRPGWLICLTAMFGYCTRALSWRCRSMSIGKSWLPKCFACEFAVVCRPEDPEPQPDMVQIPRRPRTVADLMAWKAWSAWLPKAIWAGHSDKWLQFYLVWHIYLHNSVSLLHWTSVVPFSSLELFGPRQMLRSTMMLPTQRQLVKQHARNFVLLPILGSWAQTSCRDSHQPEPDSTPTDTAATKGNSISRSLSHARRFTIHHLSMW